jgi:hypothetical protein
VGIRNPSSRAAMAVALVLVVSIGTLHFHFVALARSSSWLIFAPRQSALESQDVHELVRSYHGPALGVVVVLVLVATFAWAFHGNHLEYPPWKWSLVLIVCACADAITTSCVFLQHGIQDEVHPAVRLCAYCYGRIGGVALAKGVQTVGLLAICMMIPPRLAKLLSATGAALYLAAAYSNLAFLDQIRRLTTP